MKEKILMLIFLKFDEDKMLPTHEQKRTEDLKFTGALKINFSNQAEEAIKISRTHDYLFKSGQYQHSHECVCEWTEPEEPNPENTLKGECKYNKKLERTWFEKNDDAKELEVVVDKEDLL